MMLADAQYRNAVCRFNMKQARFGDFEDISTNLSDS